MTAVSHESAVSRLFLLATVPDLRIEALLDSALHEATTLTGSDAGGALFLFDPVDGREVYRVLPLDGRPRGPQEQLFREWRDHCHLRSCSELPVGSGVEGNLFREGRSRLQAPLFASDLASGFVQVEATLERHYSRAVARQLAGFAQVVGLLIRRLLLREHAARQGLELHLVGASPQILEMESQIQRIAMDPNAPVLIMGERGSGKELAAYAIHYFSSRRSHPFLPVNSAAFSDTLLSDELFGHEKHSFTGAQTSREGIFKAAEGGTLFFDEIGDMPPAVQASLLRVLDHGELRRIGRDKPFKVNVRIVGASNKNLQKLVDEGSFRADLYDRLNVFRIVVPALRDRKGDIPLLATYFLRKQCIASGRHHRRGDSTVCLSCLQMAGAVACTRPDFFGELLDHSYPGNVRELRNLITRLNSAVGEKPFGAEHVGPQLDHQTAAAPPAEDLRLDTALRNHIQRVLTLTGNNKSEAARLLNLPLTTLINKMKRLGM